MHLGQFTFSSQIIHHDFTIFNIVFFSYIYQVLEDEVSRLLDEGYMWTSLYTQCTLGNILVAYRTDAKFDPNFCENNQVSRSSEELDLIEDELTADTLKLLKKYFEDYYEYDSPEQEVANRRDTVDWDSVDVDYPLSKEFPDTYSDEDISQPYEKKDEFVNVHKYLKSHKRDPLYSGESTELGPFGVLGYGYRPPQRSSELYYDDGGDDLPVAESVGLEAASPERDYDLYDYQDMLGKLTRKDIELLQDYLGMDYGSPAEDYGNTPVDYGNTPVDYEEYDKAPLYEELEDAPITTMEDSDREGGWLEQPSDKEGGWLEQPSDKEGGWLEEPLGMYCMMFFEVMIFCE